MNNICVYRHRRLDTNKIFYIGIGSTKRPYEKFKRNIHWKNIVKKTNYEIEIIANNLSKEEAIDLEIFLIELYGLKNLSNMTLGGEGCYGLSPGIETRKKISDFHKNKPKSKESKLKMSKAKEGMYFLDNNPNSKKVINTKTNVIFNTLKEAALSINKKYSSFKWSIKNAKNFEFKYYN